MFDMLAKGTRIVIVLAAGAIITNGCSDSDESGGSGGPPTKDADASKGDSTVAIGDSGTNNDSGPKDASVGPLAKGGDLRFSEVGAAGWFEVRNVSKNPINLNTFRLMTYTNQPADLTDAGVDGGNGVGSVIRTLPALTIPPSEFAIVRVSETVTLDVERSGPQHVTLLASALSPAGWAVPVNVVLVDPSGQSSDTLRFGSPTGATLHADDWKGAGLGAIGPSGVIARSIDTADTNGAADWASVEFETPAAPNDVNDCKVDADKDGIPDCAEAQGRTFAGEDYFAFGARPGKVDLFVEFDQMTTTDPMNILRKEAVDSTVRMFARKNIAFHGDIGPRYDAAAGLNPAAFDLGGGNEVPYVQKTAFDSVYGIKAKNMRPRRWNTFRYFVIAGEETGGANGRAELGGNDGMVFFGVYKVLGFNVDTAEGQNFIANDQAQVFAHELGHGLNLQHGGNEEVQRKPNYLSIMNYLWRNTFPVPTTLQGWYNYSRCSSGPYPTTNSPYATAPAQFFMDYSDGSRAPVNEAAITDGVLDYNCNATPNAGYSFDINQSGTIETLRDFNDWGNLRTSFHTKGDVGPKAFIPPSGQAPGRLGATISRASRVMGDRDGNVVD